MSKLHLLHRRVAFRTDGSTDKHGYVKTESCKDMILDAYE